jgi:hypothetical protein
MKDLELILNVLCNYQARYILSADELAILSEWLKESKAHEQLFEDLNNNMKWIMGDIEVNARERIQMRLIEMEETGSE